LLPNKTLNQSPGFGGSSPASNLQHSTRNLQPATCREFAKAFAIKSCLPHHLETHGEKIPYALILFKDRFLRHK